jgi:hypothetical protein
MRGPACILWANLTPSSLSQHAADEKITFERLVAETTLHTQVLPKASGCL